MTDKEQIMIDGVDITGCTWCDFEPNAEPYCRINDGEDLNCEENPNCYYKQLARKTQECVELKDKLKIYEKMFDNSEFRVALTDIRTGERAIREQRDKKLTKENNRYRKALKEVKEIVKDWYKNEWSCYMCRKNMDKKLKDILDIIYKAKGE